MIFVRAVLLESIPGLKALKVLEIERRCSNLGENHSKMLEISILILFFDILAGIFEYSSY